MIQTPPSPFIVTPIREASQEATVGDVILGALGLTGLMVLAALALGALLAFGLILWHRRHRPEDDHLPAVSPFAGRSNAPPSAPDR